MPFSIAKLSRLRHPSWCSRTRPLIVPPLVGGRFFSLSAQVPNSLPRTLQSTAPHLTPHLEDLPPFIPSANSLARASQTTLLDHEFCVHGKRDPRLFPKTHLNDFLSLSPSSVLGTSPSTSLRQVTVGKPGTNNHNSYNLENGAVT